MKYPIINELSKGVECIGELTYRNFLKSYNYSEKEFNDATKLEASISALFLFDYVVFSEQVTQDFRQTYYAKCVDDLVERYSNKLQNDNLIHLIDHRYRSYAEMPMEPGDDEWIQRFSSYLLFILKGTVRKISIEENYLDLENYAVMGDVQEMPMKMQFIEKEVGILNRVPKIVEELYSGKKFHETVYTIKKCESKSEPAEQKKKKEGCYIATMVYGSYDANEVLVLRGYRDNILTLTLTGRLLIKSYYFFSPTAVRLFNKNKIVKRFAKKYLNYLIMKLKNDKFVTIKKYKM